MKRLTIRPRADWRKKCEKIGFSFYDMPSEGGEPYWRETAAYELCLSEVEALEAHTKELFDRCMDAVEFVIKNNRFAEFAIPKEFWPLIKKSWDDDDPTVFGRFDLAWQPDGTVKLLEFNADTPTSLIESSAAQWFWMKDMFGDSKDQFNSIHEELIAQWSHIRKKRWRLPQDAPLYMASLRDNGNNELITEDYENVAYMAETAKAAGFSPCQIFMEDISWSNHFQAFVDKNDQPIRYIYKLYPWEWMVNEPYADKLITAWERTHWVEPIWKMLLSNKQLLVILWELFPGHPLLLPTFSSDVPLLSKQHVRKPKLSREGANVHVIKHNGQIAESKTGNYGDEGHIWQEYTKLPNFDGWNAVIGSWIVGETPVGIDFRETSSLITDDLAFFVPHYIA